MAGPFKMKGSPMQRNFGIGSPLHDNEKKTKTKMVKGSTIFGYTADDIKNKAKKAVKFTIDNSFIGLAGKLGEKLASYKKKK